jgi:molybdopterin-containing oxidoreductase family iron-sulfur binding subunit
VDPHAADAGDSIAELVRDLQSGSVEVLVILGANPVYTAPADLDFRKALDRAPLRIHQSLYYDETSFHCHWHVPETHYLESWSDVRAFDGTASIVQPLISPLYQGKSPHQLLSALLGQSELELAGPVRAHWRDRLPGVDFERFWEDALRRGVVPDTAFKPIEVRLDEGFLAKASVPARESGSPETTRPATAGPCRSTTTPALAATPAWWPARPRTTSPSSGRARS